MKIRRITITIDLETDLPLKRLNDLDIWQSVIDDHRRRALELAGKGIGKMHGLECVVHDVQARRRNESNWREVR